MNKPKILSIFLCCLLTVLSCYTDDSSGPNPARLPFEDFNEFFESNNTALDTFSFFDNVESTINGPRGTKIIFPENTFNEAGELFLALKEMTRKSDYVLLNKPTSVGANSIVESAGAVYLEPLNAMGSLSFDNNAEVQLSPSGGFSADDQSFYYYQSDWTQDASVEISDAGNALSFETNRSGWQMLAQNSSAANSVNLTINPLGYGSIPHDMRVFLVSSDANVILSPFDYDIADVSASGSVPAGMEMSLIVMVMDHFKLSAGIQTINLSENQTIDFQVEIMTVNEMIELIKTVD